jgi:NADH-quinone oxidoreductase subunit M
MLGTENVTTQNFKDLSFSEHLTFLPLVIMVFVLGVFPQPIINIVKPVITSIIEIASN